MFNVPAYSQFLDVKDNKWKDASCGIVSLKMVLDFWGKNKNSEIGKLIKLGLNNKAFIPDVGWKHKELALLVRKFGLRGRNYDWFRDNPKIAFKKLLPKLKKYPVIVSIHRNLELGKSGHLVVLTGAGNKQVFYNDPDSKTRKGIKKESSLNKFLKGWKRRIIVIYR